ncbi:D-alanyl-D-alanine carboxypeptidase/D-alanyl-D-alanine-endopeptidase (penicillin-binding protein 4) [Prosthecobacter fusiformis]|uniref:D-alanyl-D-alanine carboxypeptidase/D-alanyl-D-alanine-endopeptidase (Penicillin-binding protein 4) n=1 Tax=Prosthecobacter fusiformis TaxID=48464 RepID=A0A4R7RYF9_9BACT|nr:D-alanyl-D-alanine carboxypeptidase/D-alanyl-D-alanine-endopeptidase [Prosthecobacter fusiformis]TDU70902.1 D-alanyl-D-alanine carboxypeptidase/D-alanyl-D-alanine-endopeptidase (penicillin-binding protein 4) [Prosthecobacter fusiformis]
MKNALICFLLAVLTALLFILGREESPQPPVPVRHPELVRLFDKAEQNPALSGTVIGFCLLNAEGKTVFERQSEKAFIPASTLKTVTTATALEKWGPDYRIQTHIKSTARMTDGLIQGDVMIEGGADPMLSLEDLKSWVQTLLDKGLKRITGDIIGDGRLLAGSLYDDFWNWGDIGNGYGSGVAGLNLEHNRFTASFQSGSQEGAKAVFLGALPEVPSVRWVNEVTTGAADTGDGVVIYGGERTGVIHLRGTVPLGAGDFAVTGAVPDPERYAAHHLRRLLLEAGIVVEGAVMTAAANDVPEAAEVLITHESPPLLEIITSIHASSDNHETECLYRLLGIVGKKAPDEVVREHWSNRGLIFEGLRMEDGCGLARADFIRPLDLARLQHVVGAGPHGKAYRASLSATEDGTLRWKGGAMSGVRSYTGFVKGASGEEFSFAVMLNHFSDAQAVTTLRDELILLLRQL